MPMQAPAATEAAEGVAEKVKEKVADATDAAKTMMGDDAGDVEDHDEL